MSRLLHVTDLHASREWYAWLVREAPRYDLVCFTGDLIDECSRVPLAKQIHDVCTWLQPISTPMAICRGNHDVGRDARQGGAWMRALTGTKRWVDRPRFSVGGLSVASCGWGTTPAADYAVDLLLTHAPPAGSAAAWSRGSRRDWGDPTWRARLESPDAAPVIVLCGHVHDPEAWWAQVGVTWIFNPGLSSTGASPNHVIIDTNRRTARWLVNGLTHDQKNW